jgi:uncharacterized protein (TIGR03435 family)
VRVAILGIIAAIILYRPLLGQRPSFEVASVRIHTAVDPGDLRYTGLTDYIPRRSGQRITMRDSQLGVILAWAYHLTNSNYQLVDGRWGKDLWESSYDIEALTSGSPSDDDLRQMYQTLLEDRFHLKVHRETRKLYAYDLVVARGGSKLTLAPPRAVKNSVGLGGSSSWVEITGNVEGRLVGRGSSMNELAVVLTGKLNAPVRDRTGLKGAFDYTVVFSSGIDASDAPVLITAIGELGLRLKKTRGDFEVLVIDRLENLSNN